MSSVEPLDRLNQLCCTWLLIGQNFVTDQLQARHNRACLTGLKITNQRSNRQICEVITVFFKSPNETKTSTIKCGEDISEYTFKSGASIEVHIYCSITSHWLNATEVKIYGDKKLDHRDFKINWRPLKGANMSSNAFRMHFEETVKQFIDL